ncbi:hypothetical protein GP486_006970 [Trichoglossum hirsutum]|uniref:Uncharacterized protein n=1 Tax=Trichoglossum hirsutum TaxID=265104 RepID=A0A9P8IIP5_9PEZI|nr:hypothetical protein GP486_006970 [Trichoglossum hirsutum]
MAASSCRPVSWLGRIHSPRCHLHEEAVPPGQDLCYDAGRDPAPLYRTHPGYDRFDHGEANLGTAQYVIVHTNDEDKEEFPDVETAGRHEESVGGGDTMEVDR